MRIHTSIPLLGIVCLGAGAWGQVLPGKPEDNGLKPVSETVYINTPETINNTKTESLGIAIARNGNVIVGWEDDGSDLTDLEAVWTLLDDQGRQITPDTEITTKDPAYAGQTLTSKFLSFFRADKTAVSGRTSWGPKIKANLFGDGIGMGATAFDLGKEVAEFAPYQDLGDFPAVQLLSNSGEPIAIVAGVSSEYGARDGDIRIGDWEYLSNGNVVVVGESRQRPDLVDVYGGPEAKTHVTVRVVDKTGKEVKAVQLGSAEPTEAQMWHGAAATKNGFAIRFAGADGRAKVRLFDNAGTPLSTNLDLATITSAPIMAGGGRGDGVGFHGNGNDAYAAVAIGTDAETKKHVWVSVISTNGTVRWTKSVADDLELLNPGRCSVGIDALGRVAVVFDDASGTGGNAKIIMGRVFNADGTPMGKTFYVSEKELPDDSNVLESRNPRVAFRNDTVAVTWESQNAGTPGTRVVAARLFVLPVKPGSIESVGLKRIVADTPIINPGLDALGNWEPNASVLGTTTFLVEGNTFADGTTDQQRYVVALQPAAGGAAKLAEAFYSDNGQPFKGQINLSRQNGNPGRVAGDKRPGAVNYITGAEASPHALPEFGAGTARWSAFDRLGDGRYGTVQTFKLDVASLTPTMLSKAQDSATGRTTSGGAPGNQISRFGGDVVGLSDGNFASVVEDRSLVFRPDGNCAVATIFAPDGSIVKDSFRVADGDLWSNVAAFKGGFCVRVAGNFHFFDNAGNRLGDPVDQATSGDAFDRGRGDGTRIAAHVNSPYVFLAGKIQGASMVRVVAWDASTRTFIGGADVSEGGFRGDFDRVNLASDALNRVVVSWVARPDGYEQQQVAARVLVLDAAAKTIRPLTSSFLPFVNAAPVGGIRSIQMTVAMTTKEILIAAKGEINLANKPDQGANSPRELNFYTVISHPDPKDDPTPAAGAGTSVKIMVARAADNRLSISSEPATLPAGWVLQVAESINGPWVTQPGVGTPVTVGISAGNRFLRAAKP